MKFKLILFLVFFLPNLVFAEIYKTVDENGNVVFSDKLSSKSEVVEVKVNSVEGPATVTNYKSILSSSGDVLYVLVRCL